MTNITPDIQAMLEELGIQRNQAGDRCVFLAQAITLLRMENEDLKKKNAELVKNIEKKASNVSKI